MPRDNILIVSDSENDADMLYAVGEFFSDPFIYLRVRGRGYAVFNETDLDRARRGLKGCRAVSMSACYREAKSSGIESPDLADAVRSLMRRHRVKKVVVPQRFPLGMARRLRELGIKLKLRPGELFPERQIKSPLEVKRISAALMMAEVGLAEGIQAIKTARVARNGRLLYRNLPLTSERLRMVIDVAMLQAGGHCANTIVSSGRQACDPHERGHGVLKANQPIVIDVFPRSQKTGYFGDITRTIVKGRASEAVRRLYQTVLQGQKLAIDLLKPRALASDVHRAVAQFFFNEGYRAVKSRTGQQGFFHGLGHGIGLNIHEAPRIAPASAERLRAGHVVAIEPGLYYRGLGGVRLEDVVLVTGNGPKNLTKFEKVLEV